MKNYFVLIFISYTFLANADFDDQKPIESVADICDGKEKVTMAVVSLNNSGKEKAIKLALEQAQSIVEDELNSICIDNIEASYDKEKCQPEIYSTLNEAEKEQVSCMTVPHFARVGTGKSVPVLGDTPAAIKMKDLCVSQTKFKNFDVKCTADYCDVFSSLESIQVKTDLSLGALEDEGQPLFKVNALSIKAGTNLLGESPQLAFRANIGRDGKIKDFIQLPKNVFVETFLPPGTLKIGLDGHFDLGSLLESKMDLPKDVTLSLEKANQVIKAEVEKLKPSKLAEYDLQKRLKEELEKNSKGSYQKFLEAYQEHAPKAKEKITEYFNEGIEGDHSFFLVKGAMEAGSAREYNQRLVKECMDEAASEDEKDRCDDKEDIIDRFDVFLSEHVSKVLNSSIRKPMQDVLKNLEFIHKSEKLLLNADNFQDVQDYRVIYKKYYGYSVDLPLAIKKLEKKISTITNPTDKLEIQNKIKNLNSSKEKKAKDGLLFEMKSNPHEFHNVYRKLSDITDSLGVSPLLGSKELLTKIKKDLENIYTQIEDIKKPAHYGKRSERNEHFVSEKSQKVKFNKVLSSIDDNLEKIDAGIKKSEGSISLGASIEGFSRAGEELTVLLNGCSSGCDKFIPVPIDPRIHENKKVNSCNRPYEVAATINLETVNRYIETLYNKGALDSCTSSDSYRVCETAGFISVKNKIKLDKPPYISWDENEKSFQLVIPKVIREGDVGPFDGYLLCNRDTTSIKMKFKPVTHNGGTTIGIEGIEKIETEVKFDAKSNFCKAIVGAWAPVVGLAMVAVHSGFHGLILQLIKGNIQDTLEEGIDIPEAMPVSDIVCIDGSKGHITIYANLK